MKKPQYPIALVELHDSLVEEVCISPGGEATIHFHHLEVLYEEDRGHFQTWAHKALLRLHKCTAIRLDGAWNAENEGDFVARVLDGDIYDDENRELSPHTMIAGRVKVHRLRFMFGSGAITVLCGFAQLELLEPTRRLEDWLGPLVSS